MIYGQNTQGQGAAQPPLRAVQSPRGAAAFWVAIILAVLLLFSLGVNIFIVPAMILGTREELIEAVDADYGDPAAQDKIAVLALEGEITDLNPQAFFGESLGPVAFMKKQLDKARSDPNVKAVVIEVNSPGGSVTASEEIYHMIERFKEDKKDVPVIVYIKGMAASGGYYISCGADWIVAMDNSVTGSIGVIMMLVDASGAMEYLRIKFEPITSGPSKDVGSPFRPLKPTERELLQKIVNGMYDSFIGKVFEGRKQKGQWESVDELKGKEYVDGRILDAAEALKCGLIDEVGHFEKAYDAALRLAPGLKSAKVVRYAQKPRRGFPFMFDSPAPSGDVNMVKIDAGDIAALPSSKFLFMWQPGIRSERIDAIKETATNE